MCIDSGIQKAHCCGALMYRAQDSGRHGSDEKIFAEITMEKISKEGNFCFHVTITCCYLCCSFPGAWITAAWFTLFLNAQLLSVLHASQTSVRNKSWHLGDAGPLFLCTLPSWLVLTPAMLTRMASMLKLHWSILSFFVVSFYIRSGLLCIN